MYSGHLTGFITLICWLLWVGYWKVAARNVKPTTEQGSLQSRAGYLLLMVAAFAFVVANLNSLTWLGWAVIPYSQVAAAIGMVLAIMGTTFTIWARRVLATNWSADVAFKQGHELITSGPYHLVRHPIYTGLMLLIIGTAIVQSNWLSLVAIPLAFASFWIKLGQEEAVMTKHFPKDYPAYRAHTKRLVPFIL